MSQKIPNIDVRFTEFTGIKKQSKEEIEMRILSLYELSISCIPDPCEAAQLYSVKKFPPSIQLIENPTEAVQLLAVQQGEYHINSIDNPCQKAKDLQSLLYIL